MAFEPLFEAKLQYRADMEPVVGPEGRQGALLGSGDGTVAGPRLRGSVRWSFYEAGCDYDPGFLGSAAKPQPGPGNAQCRTFPGGIIQTEDGASIQFDGVGFALRRAAWGPHWRVASTVRFVTQDERYAWLNEVLGQYQGTFDESTGTATWRAVAPAEHLASDEAA